MEEGKKELVKEGGMGEGEKRKKGCVSQKMTFKINIVHCQKFCGERRSSQTSGERLLLRPQ